jgi:hypothetical protein
MASRSDCMQNKTLYALYAALFFAVLIPASLFLFVGDSSNSNPHVRVVAVKETANGSGAYTGKVITSTLECIKKPVTVAA